jgi:hypothetical protein
LGAGTPATGGNRRIFFAPEFAALGFQGAQPS